MLLSHIFIGRGLSSYLLFHYFIDSVTNNHGRYRYRCIDIGIDIDIDIDTDIP